MTHHLVALSFGPVQSLIGAARRTRDLWCGSWLLSEAARAAARVLHERHPGCLIFPKLDRPEEELKPQNQPDGAANIANILRAEVSAPSAEIRTLCNSAKEAAAGRLVELGEKARTKLKRPLREDVWNVQINDILECYAAWVPVEDDDYSKASRRLGATLAARKATRDFGPSRLPATEGLPKSSLDGAFETVLPNWSKNHPARRQLGLSDNEQLDALGVMKRLAGHVEQFTAYSRIAADPWIESLTKEQQHDLREAYEPLVGMELATRVSGNDGTYDALPYDAQLSYLSRLRAMATDNTDEEARIGELQKCLRSIAASKGQPVPYATILKADGDKMGQFLSTANSAEQSRRISRALHDFALRVRQVVQRHRGHAIYAGGDDVLALVPLTGSIACAKELAEQFKTSLAAVSDELKVKEGERPTLSVGLGIGHIMEPLGALRVRAGKAEKLAKGDDTDSARNALAIVLGIRSGGEHRVRIKWSNTDALDDLEAVAGAFGDGKLPSRIAYDLRDIDQRLWWLREDDGCDAKGMRRAEVRRLLDRARTATGKEVAGQQRELIERRLGEQSLAQVADLLIVARWLAARNAAELGER